MTEFAPQEEFTPRSEVSEELPEAVDLTTGFTYEPAADYFARQREVDPEEYDRIEKELADELTKWDRPGIVWPRRSDDNLLR